MRNVILGSGLMMMMMMMSVYAASACEPQEAQFFGKVKNHYDVMTSENSSECFFELELDRERFSPSAACGLTLDEVAGVEFRDSLCELKNGDVKSGILVKKGDSIYIE